MFRFADTGQDCRAIANRFFYELANCSLTFGNSVFAILDKAIFIEHGFLLSLAQFLKQTIEYTGLSSAILLSAKAAGKMRAMPTNRAHADAAELLRMRGFTRGN